MVGKPLGSHDETEALVVRKGAGEIYEAFHFYTWQDGALWQRLRDDVPAPVSVPEPPRRIPGPSPTKVPPAVEPKTPTAGDRPTPEVRPPSNVTTSDEAKQRYCRLVSSSKRKSARVMLNWAIPVFVRTIRKGKT